MVCAVFATGQLFSQVSREVFEDRAERFGIEFRWPKGFSEMEISEVKAIRGGMQAPLFYDGYGIETKKGRVVYGLAGYAFGDNEVPVNAVRADRVRYQIGYNIASASGDVSRGIDIRYSIGQKDTAVPFIADDDDRIVFIGKDEARKRFNADSILMYAVPMEIDGRAGCCTSFVIFRNPMTVQLYLFLPEEEMKHRDKYLKKLAGTVWFTGVVPQKNDLQVYENTALSKRIQEKMAQEEEQDAEKSGKTNFYIR